MSKTNKGKAEIKNTLHIRSTQVDYPILLEPESQNN